MAGKITDFIVETKPWKIRYLIIQIGSGVLLLAGALVSIVYPLIKKPKILQDAG